MGGDRLLGDRHWDVVTFADDSVDLSLGGVFVGDTTSLFMSL